MILNNKQLNQTFSALADPTRRAMLEQLAQGDATLTELAEHFDLSMPTLSRHLRVLEQAGLVTRTRDGVRRPATLNAAPLRPASAWLDRYARFWNRKIDHLEQLLLDLPPETPDER
ncbi:MAG: winged helix-turn-helix transcriptional regulator [Alphaproteobacteria bacterium]|nr:winged helix-turn-helix transcriptional regulator [Alphaproteobacteria bacterium]